MNCACSAGDNGEYPEFFNESFPVARKEHTCCECRETIPKGSKYQYVAGKWDGYFDTFKTCMGCYRVREDYFSSGCPFEYLKEELQNCLDIDYLEVPESEDEDANS